MQIDRIGLAAEGDLERVCAFFGDICAAQRPGDCGPRWDMEIYPCREDLQEHIERREMHLGWKDGRIAAAMALTEQGERWELHLFAVHPDFRGMRLSDEMLAAMLSMARAAGKRAVWLDVVRGNLPAIRLYERAGFRRTGGYEVHYEFTGDVAFEQYEYDLMGEG